MKNKVILFIACLAALLLFQYKLVMPFIYEIAASDLFLEDTGDEVNRQSSETIMTTAAYKQCNAYIANDVLDNTTVKFSDQPINAFSLGSFRYVINADIQIQPANAASFTRRYVCRIKLTNNDENANLAEADNWSIEGLSGLDNL